MSCRLDLQTAQKQSLLPLLEFASAPVPAICTEEGRQA